VVQAQPWLAQADPQQTERLHRSSHHHPAPATPAAPQGQFYAVNDPPRQADPAPPHITPPAATVMYSPVSASSLGMASSAALAPPRPLYSTSQ
jgi:hypothetical protein